jgi:hypothetical protein
LSKYKARFDKAMLAVLRQNDATAILKPWVVHDLRRTVGISGWIGSDYAPAGRRLS